MAERTGRSRIIEIKCIALGESTINLAIVNYITMYTGASIPLASFS